MIRGTATLIASWNEARTGPQLLEKRGKTITYSAHSVCQLRLPQPIGRWNRSHLAVQ